MIDPAVTPEQIIDTLGITEPEDIDIDAIAYYCGATILYERLTGCEANIAGYGGKAIITINSETRNPGRKRFSAGHELGHWMKDRGQSAFGCTAKQINAAWTENNPETRANRFASYLLLPPKIFDPLAKGKSIQIATVHELSDIFRMSMTATALRLVSLDSYPSMIIAFEDGKRRWFKQTRSVPQSLWPSAQVERGTETYKVLADPLLNESEGDVRADRWFDRQDSNRYYVRESSFRTGEGSAITLLWWQDEQQIIDIEEEEERRAARRSDWQED